MEELIRTLRLYSQDIVDAKGASKQDRLRAEGAVRAYDRVLYNMKDYTIEEKKVKEKNHG
jgi:hypothetical protein